MPASRLRAVPVLYWALAFSVLLHGVLLSVRFISPNALERVFQNSTLDVILVNARAEQAPAPEDAQAIAQHNLAGGGEADDKVIASTPLPPAERDLPGDADIEQNREQIADLLRQQDLLLTRVREQLAALPESAPEGASDDAQTRATEARRQQLMRLLAAIEKRVQEENSRPRKRYLSPSTLGATYALYYDAMRRKIEDVGTRDFPQVAGRKLYGELLMALLVNHDGRLLDARVVRGSGDRMLDRLAETIAERAAPFGAFTAAMRKDTDQFDVTAHFRFTHDATLETTLQADNILNSPALTPTSADTIAGPTTP